MLRECTPDTFGQFQHQQLFKSDLHSCAQTSLSSTALTLGTTASGGSNSLLSIVNTSFSANGSITGLRLAQPSLTVGNKPGVSQTNVGFDYSLVLSFSTPVGSALADLQSARLR